MIPADNIRQLGQVWAAWGGWPHVAKNIQPFNAILGDGSKIHAVGRPRNGICEVHSERGVEYRESTEIVLCEDLDVEGDGSQPAPSDEEISQNAYPRD